MSVRPGPPCGGWGCLEVGEERVDTPAHPFRVGFRYGVGENGGGGLCVGLREP